MGYSYSSDKPTLFITETTNFAQLYYSRWIDVISHDIHKFTTINDELSSWAGTDVLCRIHCFDPQSVTHSPISDSGDLASTIHTITREIKNIKWVAWEPSAGFAGGIDLELIDEHGEVAYAVDRFNYPNYDISLIARRRT